MKNEYFIGIDVGGTKIAVGLVSAKGEILAREKAPTPKEFSPKKTLQLIRDLVEEALFDRKIKPRQLEGIGVGIPGIVDEKNRIIRTPNMNLSQINLIKNLKKDFKTRIVLGNDANLGTLGEKWLGAGRKADNVIGIFIGTGVGVGVINDNKLLMGYNGAASEVGHMIVNPEGPLCSCGNRGCLEAYAGRWAIERDIKAGLNSGRRSIVPDLIDGKIRLIKSKILAKSLEKNDPLVKEVLTGSSEILGLACISLRHIFDPELIILGGGVIEACGDFMLPLIRKTAYKDSFFRGLKEYRIIISKLGDDAIILGAVALVSGRI
jgi:glucokinase